jgi:hypothetical protein
VRYVKNQPATDCPCCCGDADGKPEPHCGVMQKTAALASSRRESCRPAREIPLNNLLHLFLCENFPAASWKTIWRSVFSLHDLKIKSANSMRSHKMQKIQLKNSWRFLKLWSMNSPFEFVCFHLKFTLTLKRIAAR